MWRCRAWVLGLGAQCLLVWVIRAWGHLDLGMPRCCVMSLVGKIQINGNKPPIPWLVRQQVAIKHKAALGTVHFYTCTQP